MASAFQRAVTITPHDSTNITGGAVDAIYVGGAGAAVLVFADDTTATFAGLLAGSVLPVSRVKRVNATGTTATNLLGLRN